MHWDCHPSHHAATVHLQVLTRGQLDLRSTLQKLFLHSFVVLLPTVIRERRHIIKNQSVFLGVELRRCIRRTSAPSRAIAVDQLAKGGVVRGLLLCPGAYESERCTGDCQRHIQQPAPTLGMFADRLAGERGHYRISSQLGDDSLQADVPMRAAYGIAISLVLQALLFGRTGPTHLWPLLQQFLERLVVIDVTKSHADSGQRARREVTPQALPQYHCFPRWQE